MKYSIWITAATACMAMGCETTIDVDNVPTRVTSVGPIEASSLVQIDDQSTAFSQVRIGYTLRDFEGDDASIEIEICEEADDSNCGAPFRGYGGDGVTRLPTIPFDTDVPHYFEWEVGCGRLVGTELVETEPTVSYVALIRVAGSGEQPVRSPAFRLEDLGFEPDGEIPCSRES